MRKGSSNWTLIFKILLSIIISNSVLLADSIVWGNKQNPFQLYSVSDVQVLTKKNGDQFVSMQRQPFPVSFDDSLDSLQVSFDRNETFLRSGEILRSNFKTVTFDDSIGEAASFEQPLHEVWISPADYLFLNQYRNTGDFSIYFRMRPYQIKRRMDIMQKVGLFEGQKQGINCGWEGGKLFYSFYNFFWDRDGVPVEELKISTRDRYVTNRFYSVMLNYRSNEGSLALYLDGVEQEKIFVTSNGTIGGTILTPKFHRWDKSPLIIGRNFLGALDDIVLSNHILRPEMISGQFHGVIPHGMRYVQRPGIAISSRIDLPVSGTRIESLKFGITEPEGSRIKVFYRHADSPFPEDTPEPELPYKELTGHKLSDVHAKYFQWKAELYSDSNGNQSPVIHTMKLQYSMKRLPQAPASLSVLEASDGAVTLEFLRSLEMDVVRGGRYHIYYGIKPYVPLGAIKYKSFEQTPEGNVKGIPITNEDKWVTSDQRYQNRIKITVTNDMISENLAYFRNNPRITYAYPLLQKEIPYYFWVTSCDQDWSENVEKSDHESRPSHFIVVRIR